MKQVFLSLLLGLAAVACNGAPGASSKASSDSTSPAEAPAVASVNGKLSDMAWLAGQWRGDANGAAEEMTFLAPAGGLILGASRIAAGDTTMFFEFVKIAQVGEGLVLTPSPFGSPGVSFGLKEIATERAVFENPTHEFPSRIIYALEANTDGSKNLVTTIEGTQGGTAVSQSFHYESVN